MTKRMVWLSALLALMLLTVTACSKGGSSAKAGQASSKDYPEYYEQYTSLLGQNREAILSQLNLKEADLVPMPQTGMYTIPVTAAYNGLSFDMSLEFDVLNDRFLGYSYTLTWDEQSTAVKEVSSLAKALTELFGEALEESDASHFS